MPPSSGELWGYQFMPSTIVVDCLLPTGIIIPLSCQRNWKLEEIKGNLWREIKKYPLHHKISEPSSYIFKSVTTDATVEEFYDESRMLCDLRLFQPILKVIEPHGNKIEKMINSEISQAVGVHVQEFDTIKDPEVQDFRRSIMQVCQKAFDEREKAGRRSQALYAFPPDTEASPDLPRGLDKKLDKGCLIINVRIMNSSPDDPSRRTAIRVHWSEKPEDLVEKTLAKQNKARMSPDHGIVDSLRFNYVLKVYGFDEYLLSSCPLSQYRYVRQCILRSETPELVLMPMDRLLEKLVTAIFHMPSYVKRQSHQTDRSTLNLWSIDVPVRLTVMHATYVNVRDPDQIFVRVGLYHGTEVVSAPVNTKAVSGNNPKWVEILELKISVPDLPRGAKLCMSICAITKRKKKEDSCMIAWCNVSMFDYRSRLLSGKMSFHLWPAPKGYNELLYPLGITGSNPNTETSLEIEFDKFSHPVVYPDMATIEKFAEYTDKMAENPKIRRRSNENSIDKDFEKAIADIQEIIKRDPLSELSEQEIDLLWHYRKECCSLIPGSLAKLLDAVKWNSRDEVSQMTVLLKEWRPVNREVALELLDCKYGHPFGRSLAAKWLNESLTDDELLKYLLQLVQTLKYEPYLDNDLFKFLLSRGLTNKKVGHYLFWHLKSELHDPAVHRRFCLYLEAFCRGLGHHLRVLIRQVDALDKLTKLTDALKEKKDEGYKERLKFLMEQIAQSDYLESLQNFTSPLNSGYTLGQLLADQCRIMDSAKRPLCLVWRNPDAVAEDALLNIHAAIFKNGDDLRQDMLTLQVIKLMDSLWRLHGLDLRMTPYACLATGKDVGLIEVVRKAKTVYGIQRQAGKLAAIQVDSTQLFKWIKEKNKGDKLKAAVESFTYSCAGYCVATFILGIGDRNPDNIMVSENGQIFHIDFGHFLGHFKKKFGINRERVPFVLTEDFKRVIAFGGDPIKSEEFQTFQELCGRAYMILRKHANLLITLFTMMLPTGIPELQSIDDIGYLRKTLAVELKDEDALKYFQSRFCEAHDGAWTTKFDWFFHSVKHM
ncbi:phosphatidylinositol 4,5-bisphosphate 3-kinase catalytic subunit alpha isoform-like [Artemia franciscana]|uniref:phosphatidylinositol 4,5-bisphosphate 3-kinase catalytic subunit alpha isoform-like n=1 Tax=Artemia franciscana TaxID=6661 RepID=UPI0032DB4EF8